MVEPVVSLLDTANTLPDKTPLLGPELPSMQLDIDLHHFRRIQIRERSEPIHDINTAKTILSTDHKDPAANTFVALRLIQDAQDSGNLALLETSTRHLEIAIASGTGFKPNQYFWVKRIWTNILFADGTAVDPWYLLAEISMLRQDYRKAYEDFRQVVFRKPRSPQVWISIAILYYHINQFRDSIDALGRALRLNLNIELSWYNLGVLVCDIIHALHSQLLIDNKQYDANNQAGDAYDAFQRCLELNPHLQDVQARFDVLARFRRDETNAPDDHKIKKMLQCDLIATVDESDNIGGAEIVLNPIIDTKNSEQRAR